MVGEEGRGIKGIKRGRVRWMEIEREMCGCIPGGGEEGRGFVGVGGK